MTLKISDQIESRWRQFFAVEIAFLIWLSTKSTKLDSSEAVLLVLSVVLFLALNAMTLFRVYSLLPIFVNEAIEVGKQTNLLTKEAQDFVKNPHRSLKFKGRFTFVALSHLLGAALVGFLIYQRL